MRHKLSRNLQTRKTSVTLTVLEPVVILLTIPRKIDKPRKHSRPARIRVPNQEKAIFTVEDQKFLGIVQRLSLTGGSALLVLVNPLRPASCRVC
jgi:hypothetical protein